MSEIFTAYLVTFGWAIVGSISMGIGIIIALKLFDLSTEQSRRVGADQAGQHRDGDHSGQRNHRTGDRCLRRNSPLNKDRNMHRGDAC